MRRDKIRFFVFDLLSFDILRIYLQKLVLYVLFIILTMIKGLKKWVVIRLFWGGETLLTWIFIYVLESWFHKVI